MPIQRTVRNCAFACLLAGLCLPLDVCAEEETAAAKQHQQHQQSEKVEWPKQWQEFRDLLGQPKDSDAVKQFVAKYKLKEITKGPSGSFSLYEKQPFSVLYRENKVARVVVDISRAADAENQGPVITGDLPLGLHRDDLPEDVIRKLGKPTHQPERDYLSYSDPNLVISFSRRSHQLAEICLDAPE